MSDREITKKYVGAAELSFDDWSFDEVGVWRDADGFWLGTDSGCSCPIPFESHTDDSLTGPLTFEQAEEEIRSLAEPSLQRTVGPRVAGEVDGLIAAMKGDK